ncbi:unnamed protein product [Strongylus vulgaris]|uniref:Uncharacterized protein n=1 Tax=Strongylus vulgaris TaxID=40348 RepID=A0A3P7J9L1_STRVU|nr:unnamed protein product [Strongylus vulgaris]
MSLGIEERPWTRGSPAPRDTCAMAENRLPTCLLTKRDRGRNQHPEHGKDDLQHTTGATTKYTYRTVVSGQVSCALRAPSVCNYTATLVLNAQQKD